MAGCSRHRGGPDLQAYQQGRHGLGGRLTDQSVANIVKAYAQRAGFECQPVLRPLAAAWFPDLSGDEGRVNFKMMDVSRHKSVDTLRGYVRDAELFKDHAGAGLL